MKNRGLLALLVVVTTAVLSTPSARAISILNQFDTGLGELVAVGLDPLSGNLFVLHRPSDEIHIFSQAGVPQGTIPSPGAISDDFDLDFALSAINVGGTGIAADTLLAFNGDDSPEVLYALDDATGAILASQALASVGLVGGAHHGARNSVYTIDGHPTDDTIREINPVDGTELNAFSVTPAGAPAFDVSFGDIDVVAGTGNLLIVGSNENFIRELTATGDFVQDIDITAAIESTSCGLGSSSLNPIAISGIAFNDSTGTAWVSCLGGDLIELGGLGLPGSESVPEPMTLVLLPLGLTVLVLARKRPR